MTPHRILAADAPRIAKWFAERGGIALWRSINLANPTASWTTPARDAAGVVGVRLGSQGMQFKLTDAATARVRRAVAAAGADSWYAFDYARIKRR